MRFERADEGMANVRLFSPPFREDHLRVGTRSIALLALQMSESGLDTIGGALPALEIGYDGHWTIGKVAPWRC
ncbi:hypothetical protein ORS3428_30000 [Mesorhizobium sp. ORS 3428]|nr:hypothetical protein ORS3428_29135 [Mesorhizobium sp. ORS 3428]OHV89894.1 hypothetical protein ORS3428_30000 [Mesorhizobium sp. ORS 3428]